MAALGVRVLRAPTLKGFSYGPPATIRIAIEAKTIMTEHGKARRNRQRDDVKSPFIETFTTWSRRQWDSCGPCQPVQLPPRTRAWKPTQPFW